MITLSRYCAYRFAKERGLPAAPKAVPFAAVKLTDEHIDKFFAGNERLPKPFHRFLAKGAEGWALADGERWVSYGWVTNCAQFMPPHFGKNLARPMDWIFYCGTHPDYRGRGAFPALLLEMAKSRVTGERDLFLDTLPENAASRRAVAKVGFEPRGVMWSLSIKLPKLPPMIWSGWDVNKAHRPIQ